MGFRDLTLFNKAMLGKQGWRLMTRPDSLCARVIKGKYYPNGEFLTATRKRKCSETWKAILFGREALKLGMIKRIGPGDTVNIWTDNWIVGLDSFKPTIRLESVSVERVQDLFRPGTREWDEQLVRSSFIYRDALEILKIKPGARMLEDVDAWAFERTGVYSVRSCYRALKKEQETTESYATGSAGSSDDARWWKKLWGLKIPPKVRVFWWRAVHGYLPTKGELKRRHVANEDHCETCGEPGETLYHIALQCSYAVQFWKAVKEITGCKLPPLHPATWTRDLLASDICVQKDAALIICGVWSLWTGRNARRHGRTRWSPGAAVRHVASMVEDLLCLEVPAVKPTRVPGRWAKPQENWIKVNTDSAFHVSSATGAGGVVIRDSDGRLLSAAAHLYSHIPDALTGEALAARDGLQLAGEQGHANVILEVDNLVLVNLLRSEDGGRSVISGLWQEIRELGRGFSGFKLLHVNREGNVAAHVCASLPTESNPEFFWSDCFPTRLEEAIQNDCNPS